MVHDVTIVDGNSHRIEIEKLCANVEAYNKDGYDYLLINLRINNSDEAYLKELLNKTEKIYLDITKTGGLSKPIFRRKDLYKDQNFGYYIYLVLELDSIEKIIFYWSYSHIIADNRDFELYLRKDYTDPKEEVNWDPEQNAFDYIIHQYTMKYC